MSLTQTEVEELLGMPKRFIKSDTLELGVVPIDESYDLESIDQREKFILDIWRGRINLSKYKLQNRCRIIYPLVRIDIGGSPHKNPDMEIIQCPHIHIYREGYGVKWAYPLSTYYNEFRLSNDIIETVEDFAVFCHIINLPPCQRKYVE